MTRKSPSKPGSGIGIWLVVAGVLIVLVILGGNALFHAFANDNPPTVAGGPPTPTLFTFPSVPITETAVASLPATGTPAAAVANPPTGKLTQANVIQGAWYTLYFTIPLYPEKADDRHGGVDQAIVADFDNAKKTIDAAVFDYRLPSLVDAMARAAKRGVQVRLVTDQNANQDAPDYTAAVARAKASGIQVVTDHHTALMHDKFTVIDNQILWTGSMNFTPNDAYRNNNNMLRLTNAALIQNYNQIFQRLFLVAAKGSPSKVIPNPRITLDNGTVIENYFSPSGGAQKAILDRLKAATKSIRVTAFSFTDDSMASVLKLKQKAGLLVQGVFETRNNSGLGAQFDPLRKAGVDILQDGNCYTLHSKIMIIDDKTVVMGSYNFTSAANKSNDENLLIIDDFALASSYISEFDRIYHQAQNPTSCGDNPTLNENNAEAQ